MGQVRARIRGWPEECLHLGEQDKELWPVPRILFWPGPWQQFTPGSPAHFPKIAAPLSSPPRGWLSISKVAAWHSAVPPHFKPWEVLTHYPVKTYLQIHLELKTNKEIQTNKKYQQKQNKTKPPQEQQQKPTTQTQELTNKQKPNTKPQHW